MTVNSASLNWETCVPQLRNAFPTIVGRYIDRCNNGRFQPLSSLIAGFRTPSPCIRHEQSVSAKKVKAVKGAKTTCIQPFFNRIPIRTPLDLLLFRQCQFFLHPFIPHPSFPNHALLLLLKKVFFCKKGTDSLYIIRWGKCFFLLLLPNFRMKGSWILEKHYSQHPY